MILILLFPVDHDTHKSFAIFNNLYHVRTFFFLCGVMSFLYYVMFIHNMFTCIFKRKPYNVPVCHILSIVFLPYRVFDHILSSADKQQPCCQFYGVMHLDVPRDTNLRHQKRYSEGGQKNCGCHGLLGRVHVVIN